MTLKKKRSYSILKDKKGFTLVNSIVALGIMSVVMTISFRYLHFYTKSILGAQSFALQMETSHFIESFFQDEERCKEVLGYITNKEGRAKEEYTIIKDEDESSYANIHDQELKEKLFALFDLFQDIEGNEIRLRKSKSLGNNKSLWAISYTAKEMGKGNWKVEREEGEENIKERVFYVELLMDEQGEVIQCQSFKGSTTASCRSDYKHILFYNESSRDTPILSSPIQSDDNKKPIEEGKTYKTVVKTENLTCSSYSICTQGEWQHNMSCYNKCTDEVWFKGKEGGYSKAEIGDEPISETKKTKTHWCDSQLVELPSDRCEVTAERINELCDRICDDNGLCQSPDEKINAFCEKDENDRTQIYHGSVYNNGRFNLPKGDYGQTISHTISTKMELDDSPDPKPIAYLNIHAKCEYTGKWHILGASCDEASIIGEFGNRGTAVVQSIWGRMRPDQDPEGRDRCLLKYPDDRFSCSANQEITLEPLRPLETPVSPADRTFRISDLYEDLNANDRVTHYAPLRFIFDFERQQTTTFTYHCSPESKKIELFKASTYCEDPNNKPKLDLIFVIDNSGSMGDDQANLARNLPRFLDEFLDEGSDRVNLHAAVLTTERGNRTGGFYCNDCNDAEEEKIPMSIGDMKEALKTAVQPGASGSGHERSFEPIRCFLNGGCGNGSRKFRRANAALSILILTDEDDQSGGTPETFKDFLFAGRVMNRMYHPNRSEIFVGIYGEPPGDYQSRIRRFMYLIDEGPCDANLSEAECRELWINHRSDNQVNLTDPNFSDKLQEFGVKISSLLHTTKATPRPGILNRLDSRRLKKNYENPDTTSQDPPTTPCPLP